jgi:hypothetical protein
LREAIAAYVDRHKDELSENRQKWIYNNVNDKLCKAIVGCNVSKFKRTKYATSFRDALSKEELKTLEDLEMLATKLIDRDVSPFEAIADAKERLLLASR